jgi:opacity protein-like surface antigen
LKRLLIFVTVLVLGGLAQAQGFSSHVSLAAGIQGVFPGSTFTREKAELSNGLNAASQSTTNAVGGVGSFRFDFGDHSAFDFSVTANRSSEVTENISGGAGQFPTRVQSNNLEFIGSYIFRLPSTERFKPYFLVGGGMVHFRPLENGYTTAGVPKSETKATFAYGFGADFYFNESWGMRLQYRGLVRGQPDFGLSSEPFGTGLKTHVPEPSVHVFYHF